MDLAGNVFRNHFPLRMDRAMTAHGSLRHSGVIEAKPLRNNSVRKHCGYAGVRLLWRLDG